MKENKKLLDELYKNTQIATFAIDQVQGCITDKEFGKLVEKQNDIYRNYNSKILKYYESFGLHPKKLSKPFLAMLNLSTKTKLLIDKSNSHIAKMLRKGTNLGINNTRVALDKCNLDMGISALSEEIIKSQNTFYESLKKFECEKD